ncbi:hypothetical protein GCM10007916_34670 [Psychromonas marina]|uniref:DUF2437 domain-containing protein n=1 Tax=Psychromonas marina TaxID=88364 RepID=A0ABQ6E4T3_9GAMM|nr:fumarylacetoacetate hydrolase family protein [Psychromonas marina]GLS92396.1 hypothetical protein GCM10007916_34670 [Psychromonas marina]
MKWIILSLSILISSVVHSRDNENVRQLVRFEYEQRISYGEIVGQGVQPLSGELFGQLVPKGSVIALKDIKLLLPTEPQKVFAVGMNFASHISSPSDAPPPLFLKLPSSLIASGEIIQLPTDANNVHFEGELVLIIGKQGKNITESEADSYIFGVTVGNDLTERNWQSSDLQWMRSKASDDFGPVGSFITSGIDYNNVLLTTRLNGKVVQQENTKFMIHKPAKVISYLSQYFTLMPGDLIFMGTPGRTKALKNGDHVSVSIDNVGSVENIVKK